MTNDRVLKFRTPIKCEEHHAVAFKFFTIKLDKRVTGNWDVRCGPHNTHHYERLFSPVAQSEQWTGLLDKNGKEIYHGDVCGVRYYHGFTYEGAVTYDDNTAGWRIGLDAIYEITAGEQGNTIEIIGNIYENPELLKDLQ